MRNISIAGFILLAASVPSIAAEFKKVHAETGVDYAIPANSPVQFASLGEYGVATFRGRYALSGTYHYGYLTDDPRSEALEELDLYFVPDEKIAAKLPYWYQRNRVHELRLLNSNDFVAAVIPPSAVKALSERKVKSVSGRVSIFVEGYRASVECDYPTYSVSFVSIAHVETLLTSRDVIEQFGC